MAMGNTARSGGSSSLISVFVAVVATVFVGERLFRLTREVRLLVRSTYLTTVAEGLWLQESQLAEVAAARNRIQRALHEADIQNLSELKELKQRTYGTGHREGGDVLEVPFINVQPGQLELSPLGADTITLRDETIQTVGVDQDDDRMPQILGQIDLIEDGVVSGWACEKGVPEKPLEVKIFVNEVLLGEAHTKGRALHPLVDRICAGPANIGTDDDQERHIAFKVELPTLNEGLYYMRAFVYSSDGLWRKELNSSPQKFVESSTKPGLSDAVKRKDAIIRARNAQVAALYEQLHSRGIWQKAVHSERVRNLNVTKEDNKHVAFVGLISNPNEIHSRELQRKAWFPVGNELQRVADEKGVILRFIIGKSDWMTEKEMAEIRQEMQRHGDILMVDLRGFEDPAKKTLAFFSAVAFDYDVDFIFKGEKDTVVDVDALVEFLKPYRGQGNLYIGCMKSGEVIRSARQKWHEPEHWKFGDAQGTDRKANYPRHAQRQLLGVSQLVARYLAQNADVMHFYANDDVSVGVWLLGLDVEYLHEVRMCCLPKKCEANEISKNRCIGYFEPTCPGVCKPDTTISYTTRVCLKP